MNGIVSACEENIIISGSVLLNLISSNLNNKRVYVYDGRKSNTWNQMDVGIVDNKSNNISNIATKL